jgi:hypothetical protein
MIPAERSGVRSPSAALHGSRCDRQKLHHLGVLRVNKTAKWTFGIVETYDACRINEDEQY